MATPNVIISLLTLTQPSKGETQSYILNFFDFSTRELI
jgi:hypothetical protein